MRIGPGVIAASICAAALAGGPGDRALTFQDRVHAQEAIERVYYRHQVGTTRPFEQAVPHAVMERKVRRYLDQTAELQSHQGIRVTDEMLQQELSRMARGSKMPDRLLELYAALGNDPFLIKECLARATLVDRLTRTMDTTGTATKASRDIDPTAVAAEGGTLPMPALSTSSTGLPCAADDTWSSGILDGEPDARSGHSAVWTGSLMIVWGGGRGAPGGPLNTGGRYDPATDSWSPTSLVAAPAARVGHSAVWTGSLMVVWGGAGFATGGRYDPVSDTWTPTSLTSAPSTRQGQRAVWTGSLMIIWGGYLANFQSTNTGARYDPATDTWTPTSTTDAPPRRGSHSGVWTGTEMIVWGGSLDSGGGPLNTGGRYNPTTDTWSGTSQIGAPSERYGHTAVWTGSRMIVWGGGGFAGLNSGGEYNPTTNTWQPTIQGGAPVGRSWHSAIWTGSRMVIWGGQSVGGAALNTGGQFDPTTATGTWTPTSTTGAAPPSAGHVAVWTGSQMLVWGGAGNGGTGGRYDPATDLWTPMRITSPAERNRHTALWTGNEMIVWGGAALSGTRLNSGGRYNPATDSWASTATTGAPIARDLHTAVWTGSEMAIWGGAIGAINLNSGGRYDPIADTWTPTSTTGAPAARSGHVAVWTGSLMVVSGGLNVDPMTGGRYDPGSDTWTPTSTIGAPSEPHDTAVWTGSRMVVWGGAGDNFSSNTGARYDPSTDTWTPTSTIGAPAPRTRHTAVWTGSSMVVWGGFGYDELSEVYTPFNDGGRYDPAADSWSPVSTTGAPSARWKHTAAWTGNVMAAWGGGSTPAGGYLGGGARYDPVADSWAPVTLAGAPVPRAGHTAVWTGSLMMVWGGNNGGGTTKTGGRYVLGASVDNDGDGFTECQLDCNDAIASIHPSALEGCNGLDDDCNGLADDGVAGVDPDGDGLSSACDDCPQSYDPVQSDFDHDGQGDLCDVDDGLIYVLPLAKDYRDWQPESGATTWNSYRGSLAVLRATGQCTQAPGSNPLAARDCGVTAPSVFDPLVPAAGEVAFHLVTSVTGGIEGGLGPNSAGIPRPNANPCP